MESYRILQANFARVFALEQESAGSAWRQVVRPPALDRQAFRPAAVIGGEISALLLGADTAEAMQRCREGIDNLSSEEQANVRFWHSRWWRVNRLPPGLVEALSAAIEACRAAWHEARRVDDYAVVLPAFRQVVALTREKADLWREPELTCYDALLNVYDPGQCAAALAETHGWLETGCWADDDAGGRRDRAGRGDNNFVFFTPDAWRQPAEAILEACGFDLRRGRIDLGAHSMTLTAGENDIRLLLSEKLGRSALVQLLHEIGHGKLEQELRRHPLWSWRAHAPSQAFHESAAQAHEETGRTLLAERIAAGHRFGEPFEAAFRAAGEEPAGHVRSPIRLESTGLWYAWHIWVRFKIERALIEKDCQPDNLPEIWNQLIRTRLNSAPSPLREGCLQDIQWFAGLFGYFPVYWR